MNLNALLQHLLQEKKISESQLLEHLEKIVLEQGWIQGTTLAQEDSEATKASLPEATRLCEQEALTADSFSVNQSDAMASTTFSNKTERYEVLKNLGAGGMGVVQLVQDRLLGREVAIKTISINRSQMEQLTPVEKHKLFRLKTEASITAILEHPNIVPLYDLQQSEDGEISFSMRKINGETLTQILKKDRELPETLSTLLSIFFKVCDAVGYAHAQGVVHRDLKPDNVMVGQFGEVYVMDWGIAKRLSEEKNGALKENFSGFFPGVTTEDFERYGKTIGGLGTPGYMPPEQKRSAAMVSTQADIFALGKILRQCFTGLSPHEEFNKILNHYKKQTEQRLKKETTQKEISTRFSNNKKLLTSEEEDIKKVIEEQIPLDIQAIIKRATQEKPEDRYRSVQELVQDIEKYLKHFRISAREYTVLELVQKWFLRNKQKLIVTLLIFALCIGFPLYHFLKEQHQRLARFQISLAQAHREMQHSEINQAQGKSEESKKVKQLLNALNEVNFALSLFPEDAEAIQTKMRIGEQLTKLCCQTQNYHLAHYVADEIKRELLITDAQKQELRQTIIQEEQKTLTQHLERLEYWIRILKVSTPSLEVKESALREISKMPEEEIFQKLLALLTESQEYFLKSRAQNEILDQFYLTMITALGWLENPSAGEPLIQTLKQFSTYLAPIPPAQRGENKIQYMIVLADALKNSKAVDTLNQFDQIRREMGENSLFWDRSLSSYTILAREYLKTFVPRSAKQYYDRGVMKQLLGDFSGALSDYQESARLDPYYPNVYMGCGNMYRILKQHSEALASYTKAIEVNPNYAEAYNSRGNLKENELNDPQGALEDYTEGLRINPNLFAIYVNRSSLFSDLQEYAKAIEDCLSAIRLDPYCVKAYVNMGIAHTYLKNDSAAFLAYNKAIEIDPKLFEAYYNRADLWRKQKQIDNAIEDFSKVIQLNPSFVNTYLQRGDLKIQKGQYKEALKDYNEGIRLDPQNPTFYFQRGILKKTKLHQGESAELDFQKAFSFAPQNTTFLINLGATAQETGNFDEGIAIFSQILQLHPHHALSYYNRGVLKSMKKDFLGAIEDFTQSIQLEPLSSSAYGERGVAKIQSGDPQGALEDFSKAIEINPQNFHAYSNRGRVRMMAQDVEGANQDFSKAIELNPDAKIAYEERAIIKRNQNDFAGALSDYTEVLRIDPKNFGAYINRGAIKQNLNDPSGALEDFQKASEIQPNIPILFYNQGVCYYKLGQIDQALEVLELGLDRTSDASVLKLFVDFLIERMRKNLRSKSYTLVLEDIQRFKKRVPPEHKYHTEMDRVQKQIESQLEKK